VARALGSAVRSARPVSGGDINSAHEMTLTDGRVVFVKSNFVADPTMFAAEARGLAWLAQARALRVPEVLAVGDTFLVLERISPARRRADFDERLGRTLAALHRFGAPGFGLDHDNFIGRLPQSNTPAPTWPELPACCAPWGCAVVAITASCTFSTNFCMIKNHLFTLYSTKFFSDIICGCH